MVTLKEKTARGLLWGGVSSALTQVLNVAFGICLGRKLTPADYGLIGMLTVFVLIASALQEGGFISALNKRRNVSADDYNAVFWFNVGMGLTLYALLFLCAPLIALFFREPVLTPLSRYVFLGFLVSSFGVVPRAILFREMRVKETTVITLVALLTSGLVAVAMVWNGMVYWGLATQSLVYAVVLTLQAYALTRFRPRLSFSARPVREMFGFSSRLIVTNIFITLNQNLFAVLLGRFYGKADTGNFTQANKWNAMGHTLVSNTLASVAQPVFAQIDDRGRQLAAFRKLLRFTACLAFPAMFGMSLVAPQFLLVTIGPQWSEAAGVMSLLCVWGAFVPVQQLFSNLLIARGHSGTYMWGTILLAAVQLAVALAMRPLGVDWMLRVFVAVNIVWLLFWHYFVHREIGLRLRDVVRDLSPYALLAAALCLGAQQLTRSLDNAWAALGAKVVLVAAAYCLVLWLSGSVIFREGIGFLLRRKV